TEGTEMSKGTSKGKKKQSNRRKRERKNRMVLMNQFATNAKHIIQDNDLVLVDFKMTKITHAITSQMVQLIGPKPVVPYDVTLSGATCITAQAAKHYFSCSLPSYTASFITHENVTDEEHKAFVLHCCNLLAKEDPAAWANYEVDAVASTIGRNVFNQEDLNMFGVCPPPLIGGDYKSWPIIGPDFAGLEEDEDRGDLMDIDEEEEVEVESEDEDEDADGDWDELEGDN
ncbi:hypothetical protein H0H87_010621, partial [Tephrocybe sp. NHM501043]